MEVCARICGSSGYPSREENLTRTWDKRQRGKKIPKPSLYIFKIIAKIFEKLYKRKKSESNHNELLDREIIIKLIG